MVAISVLDLERLPVVAVSVDALSSGFSPRLAGEDMRNVHVLAEIDGPLPPLLVHRATNRVIDGMHRLLAARIRGQLTVFVRYYDGDEINAFLIAVQANVAHGLPLSLSDRKAAAKRIIEAKPDWSDRRIAQIAGLSDKTVAGIRRGQLPYHQCPPNREGSDGRRRPVDADLRREEVARILSEAPDAPLRQVAARAGVSPETVRAIRARISQDGGAQRASPPHLAADRSAGYEPQRSLQFLLTDPALRSTDAGRLLLRTLSTLTLLGDDPARLVESVPGYALDQFRRLAAAHSELWHSLADHAAALERQAA